MKTIAQTKMDKVNYLEKRLEDDIDEDIKKPVMSFDLICIYRLLDWLCMLAAM